MDSNQFHVILKFSIMTSSAGRDVINGRSRWDDSFDLLQGYA